MIKLATYNVEWFAKLFDAQNNLIEDGSWSGRYDVTKKQQINALADVIKALDSDAIMVIEAPNTGNEQSSATSLKNFAKRFKLRQSAAINGFENGTEQEITLMYDPKKLTVSHDPLGINAGEKGAKKDPRFDAALQLDLNVDGTPNLIRFSKPPLEVALTTKNNKALRLIGVHAKSKAPHGARTEKDVVRISIENRRKQLAQCIWIRQRVDQHIAAGDDLIVMGDFNDGPGLDVYEELFGQSGIEIVLGIDKSPEQQMYDPHAAAVLSRRFGPAPTTSRFYKHKTKTYLNALLDYIMVSPNLKLNANPRWKIWHPFDDHSCFECNDLQKSLLTASDHFPVTVEIDI